MARGNMYGTYIAGAAARAAEAGMTGGCMDFSVIDTVSTVSISRLCSKVINGSIHGYSYTRVLE